jgi:hypothetical protein
LLFAEAAPTAAPAKAPPAPQNMAAWPGLPIVAHA